MTHIHPACFVSPEIALKEKTLLHNCRACFVSLSLKQRYISHTLLKFLATWLKISGDMTLVLGDITSGEMTGDLTGNDLFCRWFVPYIRDMIGFSVVQIVIKPRKVVELQISANKTPLIQTLRRLWKESVLTGCPYQVGHVISVKKSPFVGTEC